jgi:hypothetical protein
MATDFKTYDPAEVESIRMMLEAESKEGRPLFYEVKIDGFTRILKTNKVERFEELHNFLNEKTKELVISIFPDPNTNRKEWYKFKMGEQQESLNGLDMETKIGERMKQFEERFAMQRMEEKLSETEKKLEQAELYIEILEDKLEDSKTKPNHLGSVDIGKFVGTTIKEIAVHHPRVLDDVPVLNGIARVIQEDMKNQPAQLSAPSSEGAMSFKAKTNSPNAEEVSEHEEAIQRLSAFIGEHFDEDQKIILGAIILELGEKQSQLIPVAELLGIDVNAQLGAEE